MLEFQMAEIESAALKRILLCIRSGIFVTTSSLPIRDEHTYYMDNNFSSLTNVRSAMNDLESIEGFDQHTKGTFRQLLQRLIMSWERCQQLKGTF